MLGKFLSELSKICWFLQNFRCWDTHLVCIICSILSMTLLRNTLLPVATEQWYVYVYVQYHKHIHTHTQQLTEAELGCLDSLYRLLAPNRAGNPSYQSDLLLASDHFLLLFERSAKEMIGSTCMYLSLSLSLPPSLSLSLSKQPFYL